MIDKKSPIFAPLDGFTDIAYRRVIRKLYPEWKYLFTGFLRLPVSAAYKPSHIKKFYGDDATTVLHLLTTPNTLNEISAKQINDLGIPWLDLNFGCPSARVNSRQGGSALLATPLAIKNIVTEFRKNYSGFLSVKIRAGYQNDSNFNELIKIFNQEGVDAITVHGRLQSELYRGHSKWSYIQTAKQNSIARIIGNGDVYTTHDYARMLEQTNCDSIMLGRGALRTPWFPRLLKNEMVNEELEIKKYFKELHQSYLAEKITPRAIVSLFKGLSFHMFDTELKKQTKIMQTVIPDAFFSELDRLCELKYKQSIQKLTK